MIMWISFPRIDDKSSLADALVNSAIEKALEEADERGITGKEVTPYILKKVVELTGGASLAASILIKLYHSTDHYLFYFGMYYIISHFLKFCYRNSSF